MESAIYFKVVIIAFTLRMFHDKLLQPKELWSIWCQMNFKVLLIKLIFKQIEKIFLRIEM